MVAGTAIATHVATGALGTAAYRRSGQLRHGPTRRTAVVLAAVTVVGTPLGVLANGAVSGPGFGILLGGGLTATTGVLVWVRERRARSFAERPHPELPLAVIAGVGTIGYAAQGAIDWSLALVVGVPELAGVLLGWRIAQLVPAHRLKDLMAAALIGLAPYLAVHG